MPDSEAQKTCLRTVSCTGWIQSLEKWLIQTAGQRVELWCWERIRDPVCLVHLRAYPKAFRHLPCSALEFHPIIVIVSLANPHLWESKQTLWEIPSHLTHCQTLSLTWGLAQSPELMNTKKKHTGRFLESSRQGFFIFLKFFIHVWHASYYQHIWFVFAKPFPRLWEHFYHLTCLTWLSFLSFGVFNPLIVCAYKR